MDDNFFNSRARFDTGSCIYPTCSNNTICEYAYSGSLGEDDLS